MDVRSRVEGLRALHAETLGDARVCVAVPDGPVDLISRRFRHWSVTRRVQGQCRCTERMSRA
jgi:hypothetical protein